MIGPTHFLYTFPHRFNSFQTSLKPPNHAGSWSSESEGTRGGLGISLPLACVCMLNTRFFSSYYFENGVGMQPGCILRQSIKHASGKSLCACLNCA